MSDTKIVNAKVEGISGDNKVCVIHPYKVLSIEKPRKEKGVCAKTVASIKKFFGFK